MLALRGAAHGVRLLLAQVPQFPQPDRDGQPQDAIGHEPLQILAGRALGLSHPAPPFGSRQATGFPALGLDPLVRRHKVVIQ